MQPTRVAILGAGELGLAIANRLRASYSVTLTCRRASRARSLRDSHGLNVLAAEDDDAVNATAAEVSDIVLLAARPEHIADLLPRNFTLANPEVAVVSLAAGLNLDTLTAKASLWGVYRAMPNIAAEYGQSFTALVRPTSGHQTGLRLVESLFEMLGPIAWIEEEHLDRFAAEAACSIAFYLALLESAVQASQFGLHLASKIANTALAAAATLASTSSVITPAQRIEQLATPGGMTEAGLRHLLSKDGGHLIPDSINVAEAHAIGMVSDKAEEAGLG